MPHSEPRSGKRLQNVIMTAAWGAWYLRFLNQPNGKQLEARSNFGRKRSSMHTAALRNLNAVVPRPAIYIETISLPNQDPDISPSVWRIGHHNFEWYQGQGRDRSMLFRSNSRTSDDLHIEEIDSEPSNGSGKCYHQAVGWLGAGFKVRSAQARIILCPGRHGDDWKNEWNLLPCIIMLMFFKKKTTLNWGAPYTNTRNQQIICWSSSNSELRYDFWPWQPCLAFTTQWAFRFPIGFGEHIWFEKETTVTWGECG